MKRIVKVLLSLTCIFGLVACSQETTSTSNNDNVLVVYYSATGNTKEIANYIVDNTGADLFEIELADPYTDDDLDYTDDNSRVVYEYENPEERVVELKTETPDNWEDYDTVFIGYPIWWGIAAWPVSSFVQANDFKDKTVIPFCTSVSSGLGDSVELLSEAAGKGEWKEGNRFESGASESEVKDWLEELGY